MPASCIYISDGSVAMNITGGVAPYTIHWSNGQTSQNASNLATGDYYVTVIDVNGCSAQKHVFVGYDASANNCYCKLTGIVYDDMNGNCIKDAGEQGIHNVLVKNNNTIATYNINSYVFTDSNGVYSFIVPTGNYNMQEVIQYLYPLSSCQNNINPIPITASSGCIYNFDFANVINPLHDTHIYNINLNQPVPGNTYTQQVVIKNDGTVNENNVQFGYVNDGQLSYSNSSSISLAQVTTNWYNNVNPFPILQPGQSVSTYITYNTPTTIPLGTIVDFSDSTAYTAPMNNWLTDYTPWNNVKSFNTVVIGSFDPNYKEVSPQGIGPMGYITTNDSVFDYTIHFQNTGTGPANKVVVKDTLDADLDWESLRPGYSNHAYVATINNNGELTFTFNNINLPDMNNFPLGSIGVVTYSIKTKRNLPQFTQFKNSASIFFDYNTPVRTNVTLNTINNPAGISQNINAENSISLSPNPASDGYSIKIVSDEDVSNAFIRIYNMTGSLVSEKTISISKGQNLYNYSVSNLDEGIYLIKILGNKKQYTVKLVAVK